jgi:methionine synthase / methylenetetrahydrofolate reductase(NADPH)
LYEKGFYINRSFEELSLTEPSAIRDVVRGFKRAGAQIFHTNTFNASVPKLTQYGLQDQLEDILTKSAELTLEVANGDGYVVGLIGPLGVLVEPLGPTSIEETEQMFARNVAAFEKAGVDAIGIYAIHDFNELKAAIRVARKLSSKPLIVATGVHDNLRTSYGHTLVEFAALATEFKVEVLGICGEVGPSGMLTAVEHLRPLTHAPIMALPNAGLPRYVNDQYIYLCSPDYLGKYAKRFVQAGANIVGGHCGVYETHVKAISNAVRMIGNVQIEVKDAPTLPPSILPIIDKAVAEHPIAERSALGAALASGKNIFSVELVPPGVGDFEKFLLRCKELVAGGVKFVNIPDGARAMARISSIQLSNYVKEKFDLEPIPHFTCRDRNLIGLQSDLLGAHIQGVRNLLLVTGDPPKLGNNPGATAVYDVDSIGLTHIVSRMNKGLDLGGVSSGGRTEFVVGVALNPTAKNRELEIQRIKYKIEAGADYAITQPIYNLETYKSFLTELGDVKIPIIMGIWPLISLRNAEFLKNEVPGVDVPDWAVEEMRKAGDSKEEAIKRGIEIAVRTVREAKGLVAGFQVSAPFNKADVALQVIHNA